MVCNAHLFWDPDYEYVKLCQVHYLCLKIEAIQQDMGYAVASEKGVMPVLLCGDFNSLPGSLVHSYLSTGVANQFSTFPKAVRKETKLIKKEDFHQVCWTSVLNTKIDWHCQAKQWLAGEYLECPLQTCYPRYKSAYASYKNGRVVGEMIKYTNSVTDFHGVIDYIFYHDPTLLQTKRLYLPLWTSEFQLKDRRILPDRKWPSDHFAIGAEFVFR